MQCENADHDSSPPLEAIARSSMRPADSRLILLAEDDTELRCLLSSAMKHDGYLLVECSNGVELLNRLASIVAGKAHARADLVISDIRMPGVTGLEILQGIPELKELGIPVVLITAFGDAHTHERARQLGAAAVIDKPFHLQHFRSLIHMLLSPT